MSTNVKQGALNVLLGMEGWLDRAFGQKLNPMHHLGALSFFYFWVVTGSGIYLLLVWETGVRETYASVE